MIPIFAPLLRGYLHGIQNTGNSRRCVPLLGVHSLDGFNSVGFPTMGFELAFDELFPIGEFIFMLCGPGASFGDPILFQVVLYGR